MVFSPFCFPELPVFWLAVFTSVEELCELVEPMEPELCEEPEELGEVELGEVELCEEPCELELGEVELCDDPYDPCEPELMLPLLLLLGEVELGSVEVGDVELCDPLVLLGDVELCDPLVLGDVELCEPELMVPLLLLLWGVVLPALP